MNLLDILHEFHEDDEDSLENQLCKQSVEINDLKEEIRSLRIAVATAEATNTVLEKELKRLRARHRNKRRTHSGNQRSFKK